MRQHGLRTRAGLKGASPLWRDTIVSTITQVPKVSKAVSRKPMVHIADRLFALYSTGLLCQEGWKEGFTVEGGRSFVLLVNSNRLSPHPLEACALRRR
jgi:hypothetical protein